MIFFEHWSYSSTFHRVPWSWRWPCWRPGRLRPPDHRYLTGFHHWLSSFCLSSHRFSQVGVRGTWNLDVYHQPCKRTGQSIRGARLMGLCEQGKKVCKTYCGPMLTTFLLLFARESKWCWEKKKNSSDQLLTAADRSKNCIFLCLGTDFSWRPSIGPRQKEYSNQTFKVCVS